MRRIARAATSAREFHSGEPGEASGRHRLQARKPASWAAAADRVEAHVLAHRASGPDNSVDSRCASR